MSVIVVKFILNERLFSVVSSHDRTLQQADYVDTNKLRTAHLQRSFHRRLHRSTWVLLKKSFHSKISRML